MRPTAIETNATATTAVQTNAVGTKRPVWSLRDDVVVQCTRRRGGPHRPRYRLRSPAGTWHQLDAAAADQLATAAGPNRGPAGEGWRQWAGRRGLLRRSDPPSVAAGESVIDRSTPPRRRWRQSPWMIRIPIRGGSSAMTHVADRLQPLASRFAVGSQTVFVGVTAVAAWVVGRSAFDGLRALLTPSMALPLLIVWITLKFIHETAHAVACRRHGCSIGPVGVGLMMFAPIAFIDVTQCWGLPRRRDRMAVAAAGMFAECVVTAAAFWVLLLSDDPMVRTNAAAVIATAGISTVLGNANFLMRLDGYYILIDALDTPNLYARSRQTVVSQCRRLVGLPELQCSFAAANRWASAGLAVYGWAAIAWRLMVVLWLIAMADHLGGTPAAAVAAVGTVPSSLGLSIRKLKPGVAAVLSPNRTARTLIPVRVVITTTAILVIASVAWFVVPIGRSDPLPTICVPHRGSAIAAGVEGVWSGWKVEEGQRVRAGQILATIEQPEITMRRRDARLELRQSDLAIAAALDADDPAVWHQQSAHRVEAADRLHRIQRRLTDGIVTAPIDGIIHFGDAASAIDRSYHRLTHVGRVGSSSPAASAARGPRRGRWVQRGEVLASILADAPPTFVAYVPPERLIATGIRPGTKMRLSGPAIDRTATVESIAPGATSTVRHHTLTSLGGGPMLVVADDEPFGSDASEDRWRLLRPWVPLRLVADQTGPLPIGRRMTARVANQRRTAHQMLCQTHERWLRQWSHPSLTDSPQRRSKDQ